jgi:hypothetical protein
LSYWHLFWTVWWFGSAIAIARGWLVAPRWMIATIYVLIAFGELDRTFTVEQATAAGGTREIISLHPICPILASKITDHGAAW